MAQTKQLTELIAFLVGITLLCGCQSANFQAANLPAEFRAAEQKRGEKINLAQLSSIGAGTSRLAPGDLLEVTIATGRKDEKTNPLLLRVANDGRVTVPLVGPVPVAGLETFDASQQIAQSAMQRGIYVQPVVTVAIKTKATNRITILGAVTEPGVHEIPRGSCDIVTALAAAGGLTDEASDELEIMRQMTANRYASSPTAEPSSSEIQQVAYQSLPGSNLLPMTGPKPQLTRIRLAEIRQAGQIETRLADRDVVMVPKRKGEFIHVTGLVNNPGQFDLPSDQDVHLLDAVALAGGFNSLVADKAFIIRRIPGKPEPVVIQASIGRAKRKGTENIRLAAGDTISIEQTPVTVVVDTITKIIRFSVGLSGRASVF